MGDDAIPGASGSSLSAGAPLEAPPHHVGHRTITLVDHQRAGRVLAADIWYPAAASAAPPTVYDVFPGVSFTAATARHEAPAMSGQFPLVLMSHGRTGMRVSYSMLCDALAARGAVVVSSDHPGDSLMDWLTGRHSDDRTNEVDRVADAHVVLHALLHGAPEVPVDVVNAIDHAQVVLAGHSYGAYTAFATAAGSRGVEPHQRVRAVMGFQPYTRTMSDGLLGRITVPSLLVVSLNDTVTPPHVDAERPWALLRGRPAWRLDLEGAGHQASSDISLYAELAHRVPQLPQLVRDYLMNAAAGSQGAAGRSWRQLLAVQLDAMWAFMQIVLELDPDAGEAEAERLQQEPGVVLHRR
ncbi:MAG: hypothetical protein Q7V88_10220 [Actinomycetota bacterium]|nr:hypothetical protein [Actinomycetota bacterium]